MTFSFCSSLSLFLHFCLCRLGDLYKQVDRARPGVHFSDERPMVIGRGGQKGDIYQLVMSKSFIFSNIEFLKEEKKVLHICSFFILWI